MQKVVPKKVGYARVSTYDQNVEAQVACLQQAGCDVIYTESKSGAQMCKLKMLEECIGILNKGDTLVVIQISRLGRNLLQLVTLLEDLKSRGILFISLKDNIDFSTLGGTLTCMMLAVLAQHERETISERTKMSLQYKKSQGIKLGRPVAMDKKTMFKMLSEYESRHYTKQKLSTKYNISFWTVEKYLYIARKQRKHS
jgi:DNA invertase Pin-like site-specific DNA recombinase